jgi:hypothetical protein
VLRLKVKVLDFKIKVYFLFLKLFYGCLKQISIILRVNFLSFLAINKFYIVIIKSKQMIFGLNSLKIIRSTNSKLLRLLRDLRPLNK